MNEMIVVAVGAVNNETIYSPFVVAVAVVASSSCYLLPSCNELSTTFRCLLLTYVRSSRQLFALDASHRIALYIQLCFIISAVE